MPIARKIVPFWETTDHEKVKLYNGDVLETLKRLPSGSVQMVCTSPPYWGLRSYLDSEHEHKGYELGSEKSPDCKQLIEVEPGLFRKGNCAEENWEEGCHVCRMVLVFREVRRVLRDDGTLWLNYGDSYGNGKVGRTDTTSDTVRSSGSRYRESKEIQHTPTKKDSGLPSGNLVGVPWRVALALQADGWILRSDIPWVKRSAMPESVKNRPAKALEYVFMFAKKMGYFYDAESIKKNFADNRNGNPGGGGHYAKNCNYPNKNENQQGGLQKGEWNVDGTNTGRNFRNADLWFESVEPPHGSTGVGDEIVGLDVTSESYPGAHFATFGVRLITPMIKAGTSEKGCCSECGAPWKRVVEEKKLTRERPNDYVKRTGEEGTGNSCPNSVAGVETKTVGWEPSCECNGKFEKRKIKKLKYLSGSNNQKDCVDSNVDTNVRGISGKAWKEWQEAEHSDADFVEVETMVYVPSIPLEDHPVSPCIVMDPFCGSGTTNAVCITLGRNSIGIELSKEYLINNAITRIEGEILARPALAYLVPREARKSTIIGEDITG